MRWGLFLAVAAAALAGCASPQLVVEPPRRLPADPNAAALSTTARALSAAEAAVDPSLWQCEAIETDLFACPSAAHLNNWAWATHLLEPEERFLAAPLVPADPVEIREGLDVYDRLLHSVARRTRSQMDLWEHTPALSATEIQHFAGDPDLWADTVSYRSAPPGRSRRDRLRELVSTYRNAPKDLRHLVLRDGVFYFEDPLTAHWAAGHLLLRDLFDEEQIVLERGGRAFRLERGRSGHYYHTAPELDAYRARLTLFDRVGVEGALRPPASYHLSDLRRRFGIDHIEVGVEQGTGRRAEVVFLSGQRAEGILARAERGRGQLALLGEPSDVAALVEASRNHAVVVYGLVDTAFSMVRENLFFDEPANEVGQQDGIMRVAFIRAFRRGDLEYTVNGVTYDIYDSDGRPRPPQVCIDYITDAVERYAGRWWSEADDGEQLRTGGRIDVSDYMAYRQVRRLVQLAESRPHVASVVSFKSDERVPFRQREDFFQNLWKARDLFRIADVITIYGMRSDGRNHWHSFYVYDTDPIHGMPITLTDQAGHARIRAWTSLMSNAPARFVRDRVRWNPDWILNPTATDTAASVAYGAVDLIETWLAPSGADVAEASDASQPATAD